MSSPSRFTSLQCQLNQPVKFVLCNAGDKNRRKIWLSLFFISPTPKHRNESENLLGKKWCDVFIQFLFCSRTFPHLSSRALGCWEASGGGQVRFISKHSNLVSTKRMSTKYCDAGLKTVVEWVQLPIPILFKLYDHHRMTRTGWLECLAMGNCISLSFRIKSPNYRPNLTLLPQHHLQHERRERLRFN